MKELKKIILRKIGAFFLRFFMVITSNTPLWFDYLLGWILGNIQYYIDWHNGKITFNTISTAFPDKPKQDQKKLVKDFMIFMIQSSLELIYFLNHKSAVDNIYIEGRNNLNKALQQGRGVILVTAHFGNFPLLSLKLANDGYPVHVVIRPMRDEKSGDYVHRLRTKTGVKTIFSYPRRDCITGILKALRNNEIVIIQMDQNFGTGGVWVRFFNKLAATPVGPVVFALRTKSAIVPAYIYRESRGRHVITIEEQESIEERENKEEMILVNVVKLSRIIEKWIRNRPVQWFWIHRRWKSTPPEEVEKFKFKVEV